MSTQVHKGVYINAQRFRSCVRDGMTLTELAETFFCSTHTIQTHLEKNGLKLVKSHSVRPSLSALREAAENMMTVSEAALHLKCHRRVLTEQARIHKLWFTGMRNTESVRKSAIGRWNGSQPVAPFGVADDTPPSAAMIRLAQFDPVIMRALMVRTGQIKMEDGV